MSARILEGAGFSRDILIFLRLLAERRVRYLLIGGEAVIYHGYPRLTGDIDFFYENSALNVRRLFEVLIDFWEGTVPGLASAEELREQGLILQFGRPPHRIDLMNLIDGVAFQDAWPSRIRVRLKTKSGLVPALYMDLRSLLANKEATGRPKDLDDSVYLREKLRRSGRPNH